MDYLCRDHSHQFYDFSVNCRIRESSRLGGYWSSPFPRSHTEQRLFLVLLRTMAPTLQGTSEFSPCLVRHMAVRGRTKGQAKKGLMLQKTLAFTFTRWHTQNHPQRYHSISLPTPSPHADIVNCTPLSLSWFSHQSPYPTSYKTQDGLVLWNKDESHLHLLGTPKFTLIL